MTGAIKKKNITRNRDTLTCIACRSRKLKCDRGLPCGSCVKRGDGTSCSYAKNQGRKEIVESDRSTRAEARLQHLEQLVQDFVQSTASTTTIRNETEYYSPDLTNGQNGNSTYAGATHYAAILEDIEDLRQVLNEEVDCGVSPPTNEAIAAETDVLFGSTPRLPLPTILSRHLPPKLEADRRVAAYFRAVAIAAPFIHINHFMRQYEQFWRNPTAAPPLWTAMLFSICHLSESIGQAIDDSSPLASSTNSQYNFSLAAAHCLAIGKYTRPQRFAVESLALFIQSRVIDTLDPSRDLGVLFGTLLQIAYCMGYHRDPDHLKHLSAFEGEMRRRAWSYCMQLDLLVSFQLGLPNNVQFSSWDTRTPLNLDDCDFDEDVAVLPPERPLSQPTRISFYTAKHMLMTVFDKILKHALSARGSRPDSELAALDTELRETYDTIPAIYRYKSIGSQLADPKSLVVTRKCVELMFQKCICVLHRKHVAAGQVESVRKCYTAATTLVTAFIELYPELKPGGQFHGDRWLLGSIAWNDYLLGIMVLCLVICQHRRLPEAMLSTSEKQTILQLLRRCLEVCRENLEASLGARRTVRLLESLLSQINESTIVGTTEEAAAAGSPLNQEQSIDGQEYDFTDAFQGWNDPWSNVFDTQEWEFLEQCLNTNLDTQ